MNVIVQCGGRGSRLRHHTWNKPKCLLSVQGKPILYHLFDSFPDHTFHLIGDYKFDVLKDYLDNFPPKVKVKLHSSLYHKGTCSGIKYALEEIDGPFWIVWGDLKLDQIPIPTAKTTIYTTRSFPCRWSVGKDGLEEVTSDITGIPGIFHFQSKDVLTDLPRGGEFVRWLCDNKMSFETKEIALSEYGDYDKIERINSAIDSTRFFNSVQIHNTTVTKQATDDEYKHLIQKEVSWYDAVDSIGFKNIPKVINTNPLTLERIHGCPPFLAGASQKEKIIILHNILTSLEKLHSSLKTDAVEKESYDVYVNKTIDRVNQVKKLIPNFDKPSLTVNGKKVRNIFHEKYQHILLEVFEKIKPRHFYPIHGDPHFSNIIVDSYLQPWFIDPRGYFSTPGIFGDKNYDYAKVYYSAVGGFDNINRKKFKLWYDEETVEILIDCGTTIKGAEFEFRSKELDKIKLIHGLIWLAFSGYVKDDVDSMIASFYLGLYWLEDTFDSI